MFTPVFIGPISVKSIFELWYEQRRTSAIESVFNKIMDLGLFIIQKVFLLA